MNLRAFASGLFIATATLGGIYYVDKRDESPSKPTVAEMIAALEQEGYFVTKEAPNEEAHEPIIEEKVIYQMVLEIKQGMASQDVAKQLKRGNIIDDEKEFLTRLKEQKLEKSLRTGVYEVTSEQTLDEIVAMLTARR